MQHLKCVYCGMTGFKHWLAYQVHINEEEKFKRASKKLSPEELVEIVKRVEKRLEKWIIKPVNVCCHCGPTEELGHTRYDGMFLCNSCLTALSKGDLHGYQCAEVQ